MSHRLRQPSVSYAAKYPALARRRQRPQAKARNYSLVLLGNDERDAPIYLEERARLEGMHVIGAPGGGKTTFLKNLALQDFTRGRGGIVLDPHGSHPGSLFHELLFALDDLGFLQSGRVHIIDPNIPTHTVPIDFLAPLPETDLSVLSDALLQAFERVWGGEDTHNKPTIRSMLKMTFMVLAELRLPLADARLFFDPHDRSGIRERALARLSNEYARDELQRLHQISLDDRTKRDFRAEVIGPLNRVNEFVSCPAIATMLSIVDEPGQPRRTLDLLDIMNKGDIVLVNLQHGAAISEADAALYAALILRYVFLLAGRRTNLEPFFLYVDECHRAITGDAPQLMAECRKFGIGGIWSHQYMGQAGKPGDLMYDALLNTNEVKVRFRVKSPQEAQLLAEDVLPLNLERPIAASVRPTAVGQRRTWMASHGTAAHEAETLGEADSKGVTHAVTEAETVGEAIGTMISEASASGSFTASGESTGEVLAPPVQLFGPNAPNATSFPFPVSQSTGQSASSGTSSHSLSARGQSHSSIHARTQAETLARSRSRTQSRAITRGQSQSTGETQAFETIYENLPSAWHSKEHELYFAGELLRALPPGRCFVAWRGTSVCLSVPRAKRSS